jgi:hypothetical protein
MHHDIKLETRKVVSSTTTALLPAETTDFFPCVHTFKTQDSYIQIPRLAKLDTNGKTRFAKNRVIVR